MEGFAVDFNFAGLGRFEGSRGPDAEVGAEGFLGEGLAVGVGDFLHTLHVGLKLALPPVFLGDGSNSKDYSSETAKLIDEETRRILLEMEVRCADLLHEKRTALDFIARQLLEHETVSGEEILRLIDKAAEPPLAQAGADDPISPSPQGV